MAYWRIGANHAAPSPPVLIALLLLAALLVLLGAGGRWLGAVATRRIGAAAFLLGFCFAIVGLVVGAAPIAWADLHLALDPLAGLPIPAVLIVLAPDLLTRPGRACLTAAAALLALLGGGAIAVLGLAGLCLVLRVRSLPTLVWAICAALALAAPPLEGALAGTPVLIAGIGLCALVLAPSPPVTGVLAFAVLARVGLHGAFAVSLGLFVMAAGLFAALSGAARAACARTLAENAPGFGLFAPGLASVGLGVSLTARAADLPEAAAQGLEAALLILLALAVATSGLQSACTAVRLSCGRDELSALGGLWRLMPVTSAAALVAAWSLASLPPAAGFTGFYLLIESLLAAHRVGGVFIPLALALGVAGAGLAISLAALASLRLAGLALAGSPRVAVGIDPPGDTQLLLYMTAGLAVLLALAPQAVSFLCAPVLEQAGLNPPVPGLFASAAPLLLAACCGAAWLALRLAPAIRRVPAWEGGVAGGSDTAPYIPGLFAMLRVRPRPRAPTLREWIGLAGLALLIVLIVVAAR